MQRDNIKIVMVGTTHPGNVGAAARAMFTMGFTRLVLVDPQCPIGEVAIARASGALAVLERRETRTTLADAVAGCELVIATSARRRSLEWPTLDPGAAATRLLELDDVARAAIVFGREKSGLSNDELQLCHAMVMIPTDPGFSSLNVASAIQIMCYEIFHRQAPAPTSESHDPEDRAATSAELEGFFGHLQATLETTGFIDPTRPGQIMQRLRRLYLRAGLSRNEVNILRGILAASTRDGDDGSPR